MWHLPPYRGPSCQPSTATELAWRTSSIDAFERYSIKYKVLIETTEISFLGLINSGLSKVFYYLYENVATK